MRAAIELPAIAIFTIIAGALIIMFFVVLTQSQGAQAQSETQARSLQFLDTLLKSASTARETRTNITVVDETLLFTCDSTGTWLGYENNIQLPIENIIIFSPHKLTGGQLQAYTYASDIPYRALNILYLATSDYVLFKGTGADLFQYPFETQSIGANPPDARFRKIFIGTSASTTDVVAIDTVAGHEYGTAYYFPSTLGGTDNKVIYPSKELLYGAVLSQSRDEYNCVFDKYLQQVKFVNKILWLRAESLKQQYYGQTPSNACWSKYQTGAFQTIDTLANKRANTWTIDDARDFEQAIRKIQFVNQDLLTGDHCATLY